METCQLGDSSIAGSIFVFHCVECYQQVRGRGRGFGILSFIPSCAINVLSHLRQVIFIN